MAVVNGQPNLSISLLQNCSTVINLANVLMDHYLFKTEFTYHYYITFMFMVCLSNRQSLI